MSYTSPTLVLGEFKDLTVSATTAVTTTKLAQFIVDADAEINSRLGVKYSTPISGTESLVMVAMIATFLVKDRVLEITKVKTGDDKTSQTGSKSYRDKALDLINDIASGKILLTDATLKTSADGVRSYSNDNSTANIFDRSIDQW